MSKEHEGKNYGTVRILLDEREKELLWFLKYVENELMPKLDEAREWFLRMSQSGLISRAYEKFIGEATVAIGKLKIAIETELGEIFFRKVKEVLKDADKRT